MFFMGRCVHALLVHRKVTAFLLLNLMFLSGNVYLLGGYGYSEQTPEGADLESSLSISGSDPEVVGGASVDQNSEIRVDNNRNQRARSGPLAHKKPTHTGKSVWRTFPDNAEYLPKSNGPTQIDYAKLRRTYRVPQIHNLEPISCKALFNNDTNEVKKAGEVLSARPKVPIYDETYLKWTENCEKFKKLRGYITIPLTEEEEQFPLAFSISMYRDVEHTERLLRAIYQPQNIYCIHIDTKTSLLIHRTVHAIAKCFDNVFVSSHLDKIKWGDVSVLLPAINCMRDLDHYYRKRWKYFINLTGQEFPLRTNWEIVQIAKIFNGSNDLAGSSRRVEMDRVRYKWTHRWSKTYQQTIFYNTFKPKPPPDFNITFYKGELHGLFSQKMVWYIVNSNHGRSYLQWCWDSGHPSEHYWNTLNYNTHLGAPGGYAGPLDEAHAYSFNPVIRAKHWQDQNYGQRECHGKVVRGICVYGVGDVPWLAHRPELFANKFHLTFHYLAYDCLERRHRERTAMGVKVPFDASFYRNLPTVKYGRKDGFFGR